MASASATVKELLAANAASIAQLRGENKEYDQVDIGVIYDDLFVLRFLLSAKGDIKMAGAKLKETLKWRVDNLVNLNLVVAKTFPQREIFYQHLQAGIVGWLGNDLLYSARTGLGNVAALVDRLSEEDLLQLFPYLNEPNFRLVDNRTREVGVICKVITVVDLHGFSMSRFSRKFPAIAGKSSHASNVYYPQLLRHTVFLNLPTVLRMIFSASTMLMHKDTVEKQRVCPGKPRSGKQTAADCPFLKAKAGSGEAAVNLVPQFLGGTAPTPPTLKHDSDKAHGWLL
ncbi:hypothetical protein BASA81_013816 [Batrachochytrium salamandrivorans]|nr:hypothetical protein BASA81_013816 [Batrachochytrium salamandrivorans]